MIIHKLVILSSNEIKSKFYRFQFSGPSARNKIMEQNTIKRQQVELKNDENDKHHGHKMEITERSSIQKIFNAP